MQCLTLCLDCMQVLHGAVQVAKIAVLAGVTALATDKLHKEYTARKVSSAADSMQSSPLQNSAPTACVTCWGRAVT